MRPARSGVPLGCIVLLFVLPSLAQKKSPSIASGAVRLDPSKCKPATAEQRQWAGSDWSEFEMYEIACPLRPHAGQVVLYVLSVDGYDVAKAVAPGATEPKLPKAIIVTPKGTTIGTLPYAFPFAIPVSLDVTFTRWSHGFPQTVELFLEDPTVGGNRKLPPLKWDEKQGRYLETEDSNGR